MPCAMIGLCYDQSSRYLPKYMLRATRVGLKPKSSARGSATKTAPIGYRNSCAAQSRPILESFEQMLEDKYGVRGIYFGGKHR